MKWKDGIPSDVIVEDAPASDLGFEDARREFYGGRLVAESVPPEYKPLIKSAPQMLSALEYAYKRLVSDNAYVGDPLIGVVFSAITAAKGGES